MINCRVVLETDGQPVQDVPGVFVAVPVQGAYIRGAAGARYKVAWVEHGQVQQPHPIPQAILDRLPNLIAVGTAGKDRDPANQAMIDQGLGELGDVIARRSRPFVPVCTLYVSEARPSDVAPTVAPGGSDGSQ